MPVTRSQTQNQVKKAVVTRLSATVDIPNNEAIQAANEARHSRIQQEQAAQTDAQRATRQDKTYSCLFAPGLFSTVKTRAGTVVAIQKHPACIPTSTGDEWNPKREPVLCAPLKTEKGVFCDVNPTNLFSADKLVTLVQAFAGEYDYVSTALFDAVFQALWEATQHVVKGRDASQVDLATHKLWAVANPNVSKDHVSFGKVSTMFHDAMKEVTGDFQQTNHAPSENDFHDRQSLVYLRGTDPNTRLRNIQEYHNEAPRKWFRWFTLDWQTEVHYDGDDRLLLFRAKPPSLQRALSPKDSNALSEIIRHANGLFDAYSNTIVYWYRELASDNTKRLLEADMYYLEMELNMFELKGLQPVVMHDFILSQHDTNIDGMLIELCVYPALDDQETNAIVTNVATATRMGIVDVWNGTTNAVGFGYSHLRIGLSTNANEQLAECFEQATAATLRAGITARRFEMPHNPSWFRLQWMQAGTDGFTAEIPLYLDLESPFHITSYSQLQYLTDFGLVADLNAELKAAMQNAPAIAFIKTETHWTANVYGQDPNLRLEAERQVNNCRVSNLFEIGSNPLQDISDINQKLTLDESNSGHMAVVTVEMVSRINTTKLRRLIDAAFGPYAINVSVQSALKQGSNSSIHEFTYYLRHANTDTPQTIGLLAARLQTVIQTVLVLTTITDMVATDISDAEYMKGVESAHDSDAPP